MKMAPRASRLDHYKPLIDTMLRADLTAPGKQRHTVSEFSIDSSARVARRCPHGIVGRYVAERRPQIRVEAGRAPVEAFISPAAPAQCRGRGVLLALMLGTAWPRPLARSPLCTSRKLGEHRDVAAEAYDHAPLRAEGERRHRVREDELVTGRASTGEVPHPDGTVVTA